MKGSSKEEIRKAYSDAIPASYRWWSHLIIQFLLGVCVFWYAFSRLRGWHFALLPLFFLLANFIEWFYHKNAMHHVLWGMRAITVEHVGEHHSMFVAGDMAIREPKELHAVLLAPVSMAVAYSMLLLPALGAYFLYRPVAYAWAAAGAIYFVSYELLHTLYHLPINGPFRWLRKRHERHHDPEDMQRYNFNVTIPICDLVLGTYKS
jgi:hypothetical protein